MQLQERLDAATKGLPELQEICLAKSSPRCGRLSECNPLLLHCVPVHAIVVNSDDMGFTFLGERMARKSDILEPAWTDTTSCNSVVYVLAYALWRRGTCRVMVRPSDDEFRLSRDAARLFR